MASTPEDTRASGANASQIALVMLALVALIGVLWFLFLRGSPDDTAALTPPTAASPLPTVEPTEEPAEKPRRRPVETFEVFAPKDPFKPLLTVGVATGTSGAVASPTTVTGSTSQGSGSAPSGGSDISGDGGGSGNSQDVGGRRVRLIDTFRADGELRARIQVDGTVYTVGEGDRFAENFEVVSISGSCASLLYGDDQFSLCEGEEILK